MYSGDALTLRKDRPDHMNPAALREFISRGKSAAPRGRLYDLFHRFCFCAASGFFVVERICMYSNALATACRKKPLHMSKISTRHGISGYVYVHIPAHTHY